MKIIFVGSRFESPIGSIVVTVAVQIIMLDVIMFDVICTKPVNETEINQSSQRHICR